MRPSTAERGSALAETAIVAPLLALFLIGFVEVARYADYSIKVANAARAGVQYAAQNVTTSASSGAIAAAAQADASSIPGLTVTGSNFCTCADGSADAGCVPDTCAANHRIVYARVDASGTLQSLFNFPGLPASLSSITVTRSAVMRVAE